NKFRQQCCRAKPKDSKVCERHRVLRPMQHWLQELSRQVFPVTRQRLHQSPICVRVFVQLFRRCVDVFAQTDGGAVIQRMRQWNFWFDPFKTETLERKRFKKWRARGKWVDRGTNVMHKTRQS